MASGVVASSPRNSQNRRLSEIRSADDRPAGRRTRVPGSTVTGATGWHEPTSGVLLTWTFTDLVAQLTRIVAP